MNILKYWRNTLADAARAEINLDKTLHITNCIVNFEAGQVDIAKSQELIDKEEIRINGVKGIEDRKHKDWQHIIEVQALVAPFYINAIPEHTRIIGESGPFYPFLIRAILNRQGNLRPDDDTFPYIPRVHLEPQINERVNFIFSNVDVVDKVFSEAFNEQNWSDYWNYIQSIFRKLTGQDIRTYKADN
ncbi:MAG TPA: hypothetical protein VGQ59_01790, partial [Cyclobacteriaceae bacterium]|nr:hypothetical protein [Cyclobacteriaceae bacterium]